MKCVCVWEGEMKEQKSMEAEEHSSVSAGLWIQAIIPSSTENSKEKK